jgi:hypothetical protein
MVELREGRSDTGGLTDLENNATRIVQARMLDKIHFPTFCGFGQFRIYILSLVKETNRTAGKKWLGIIQKERQGRQGSGHNTINLWDIRGRPERFEPRHMDMRSDPGSPGCFPKKGSLFAIAFIKMDLETRCNGDHETRDTSAGAQFRNGLRILWKERQQLQGVLDMTLPDHGYRGGADQIDPLLPCKEKINVNLQLAA